MKAIQKFVAEDGTEFNTAAEAAAHDAKLAAESSVEAYLATTELKGAQRTMAKNSILGYLAYSSASNASAVANPDLTGVVLGAEVGGYFGGPLPTSQDAGHAVPPDGEAPTGEGKAEDGEPAVAGLVEAQEGKSRRSKSKSAE